MVHTINPKQNSRLDIENCFPSQNVWTSQNGKHVIVTRRPLTDDFIMFLEKKYNSKMWNILAKLKRLVYKKQYNDVDTFNKICFTNKECLRKLK